jgi:hypothetical protein
MRRFLFTSPISKREPRSAMMALKMFWTEYFKQSNGNLVEFGEPALLGK